MDHLKTRIVTAGLAALALLPITGCTSEIPLRQRAMPALVRTGDLDTTGDAGRNDTRLGSDRDPIVRATTQSTEYTFDRQRIIDGRPSSEFRVTTRTREMLQR